MPVPHNMVTTAFELDNFRIIKNLGIVRGITVRSRSIIGTIGASQQTLVGGGNITLLTNLCEKAREEAFEIMLHHASQLGANAVIGAVTMPLKSCKASPKCSPMAPRSWSSQVRHSASKLSACFGSLLSCGRQHHHEDEHAETKNHC